MKNLTKVLISVISGLTGLLAIPAVQQAVASQVSGHKTLTALLVGLAGIAALIHDPKTAS